MTELLATLEWYDAVGMLGVALYLTSYVFLQRRLIDLGERRYSGLSLAAACLILVSLSQQFNLAAAITNFCWVAFSVAGLFIRWRRRTVPTGDVPDDDYYEPTVKLRRSGPTVDEYEFV